MLMYSISNNFVRKKAALTILRFLRRSPGLVRPDWYGRLMSMMDDKDIGVAQSITSIVVLLVVHKPEDYATAYAKAAHRLKRIVVDREFDLDHVYYKIPCPWFQVKLIRLMLLYKSPEDEALRQMLLETIGTIMSTSEELPKNPQQNNAQNSVLFETINLAVHIGIDQAVSDQAVRSLGKFLSCRETNLRYLGLEAMARLAAQVELIQYLKRHQSTVMISLKDRDVSVRRRALDLLYSMCDTGNAREVVQELVRYLQTSDPSIRAEMVLKIAILVEKFATEHEWYMDMILQLLSVAGAHVSDEVWHRIIQVVSNNEALQEHAARSVLKYMENNSCPENLIKVGSYILGEFGHLIANDNRCTPIEQFSALHTKFNASSAGTKAMLLNTYIKFVNLFPEIKSDIVDVFLVLSSVLDAELQQRACEYMALATMADDNLLQTICEEMPPFPERPSALLSRLHLASISDKTVKYPPNSEISQKESYIADKSGDSSGHTESLSLGLADLSINWEIGYYRLLWKNDGLLYEDPQIQIGLRSEYQAAEGRVIMYFGNKSTSTYSSFTTTILNPSNKSLSVQAADIPSTNILPKGQAQQTFKLECRECFETPPLIRVSYLAGALQSILLKLPVALCKFVEPVTSMTNHEFQNRWETIGHGLEIEKNIRISIPGNHLELPRVRAILSGHRWGILDDHQAKDTTIMGAGILHTKSSSTIGVLLRAQNAANSQGLTVSVRGTVLEASRVLGDILSAGHLAQGMP